MLTMSERRVVERPDGDLTIDGTGVWMPADERELARELDWTHQRAADILAAMDYLSVHAGETGVGR